MQTLKDAGFVDIQWETMNERWLPFVNQRIAAFRGSNDRQLRVHGEALTKELDLFYSTVQQLFTRGNLGGARIRARKAD